MTSIPVKLVLFRDFAHHNWIYIEYFISIVEVLKVERSNEYEKELWQYSSEERLNLVPELKEKGNKLYAQKLYDEAEDCYRQAIAICEQLMIRWGTQSYYTLLKMKNITCYSIKPLLLNLFLTQRHAI